MIYYLSGSGLSDFDQQQSSTVWLGIKRLIRASMLLASLVLPLSCAPQDASPGSQAATKAIIRDGLVNVPDESILTRKTLFSFGLPYLTATQLKQDNSTCDGAAGSVAPPLTSECMAYAAVAPALEPMRLLQTVLGGKDHTQEVDLPGIQHVWIGQSRPNDCWAATLQMARDYLGLPHVEQNQILASGAQFCPAITQQGQGADLFQIIYVSRRLFRTTDSARTLGQVCSNSTCIVSSLTKGHPVIMLKDGHATLIIGADYDTASAQVHIARIRILDPDDQVATIKTIPFYQLCSADAFLAY